MKPSDRLSLDEASKRIAERDLRTWDEVRQAENRTRTRIRDHVEKRKLIRQDDDSFLLGDLAAWAQRLWPGKFDDWPATNSPTTQTVSLGVSAGAILIPSTGLEDALAAAYERIAELEAENASLRPDAQKWRDLC